MPKLLIIESPNKVKTLKKFLPADFEVLSTVGHIRDLSKSNYGMGFNRDFEPQWTIIETENAKTGKTTSKQELIDELIKKAKRAQEIYLATDPDREGEAIAWHVFDVLSAKEQKKCKRITFNEITKQAIHKAFDNKRDIDMNLVNSQLVRRMLDRLVGYRLSQLVQAKINAISAGRVQTVVLDLINEREQKIAAFQVQQWYEVAVTYHKHFPLHLQKLNAQTANLPLVHPPLNPQALNFSNEADAKTVLAQLGRTYTVTSILAPTTTATSPKPPFKTASLQQEAIHKFG